MKHVISVLVENKSGVLARISGLFSARGFNIDNLAVGETEDPTVSRMTIVLRGDDTIIEQVCKQLNKLIDVIKVLDLTKEGYIERELLLARINAPSERRAQILELSDIFKGKIVEVTHKFITVELSGDEEKTNAFIDLISPFGIKEMVRTGKIAIARLRITK